MSTSNDELLLEQLIRPIVEKILGEREPVKRADGPEAYLTVKEASRQSGVPEQTIRKWISQKRVPVHRTVGRAVRVRLSDILKENN